MNKFMLLIVWVSLQALAASATPDPIRLASQGSSPYDIRVPADAVVAEQKAALELQKYFFQVSGCWLPVLKEGDASAASGKKHIYVGNGVFVRKNIKDAALLKDDQPDRIVIRTFRENLVLTGTRPRGSLYAVYQFLEDQLGCRWWAPGAMTIPSNTEIMIPALNTAYSSPFEYRENFQTNVLEDSVFATILKLNGHHQRQTDSLGNHYTVLGFCHTFTGLLPIKEYFTSHPEWFVDPLTARPFGPGHVGPVNPVNPRRPDNIQICLSAEGVVEEVTKHAIKWIDEHPRAGYISVSQMDLAPFCTCDKCQAVFEREGSQSGIVVDFVNKITVGINKKYPSFKVITLAYGETETVPKTVKPGKNVIIQLAPLFRNAGFPVDSDSNTIVRNNLLSWSRICKDMFVWNYTTNYRNTMMPFPTYSVVGKDIAYFAANNVKYIFEEGNAFTQGFGDFEEMRSWLIAKLLWDPGQNADSLMKVFLHGYYGPAGAYMSEYIGLILSSFYAHPQMLSVYSFDYTYLTLEVMNKLTSLVNDAKVAVQRDPVLTERVRKVKLSLDLTWIFRYDVLKTDAAKRGLAFSGPTDKNAAGDEFLREVRKLGVTHYGEWNILPEGFNRILVYPEDKRRAAFRELLHSRN